MRALLIALLLTSTATAQIEGPTEAAPGDLVVLSAVGTYESSAWMLSNSDKSYLPVDDGKRVVFASGTPGVYAFVLATSVVESETQIVTRIYSHKLTITGPAPKPNPPDPKPPKPDGPDEPDLSTMAAAARDAARRSSTTSLELAAAASNCRTAASKAAGLSWSVAEINDELRRLNRVDPFKSDAVVARWKPFLQWFGEAMSEAQDPTAAIEALEEIARGLDAAVVTTTTAPGGTIKDTLREIKGELQNIKSEVGQ